MTSKATFDQDSVRDYQNTHGHAPRGFGNWSFSLGRDGSWTTVSYQASFTDARTQALAEARSLGCNNVVLNS